MLPPFIIEEIMKREKEERARYEQPQLEVPRDMPRPRVPSEAPEDKPDRGIVILEL